MSDIAAGLHRSSVGCALLKIRRQGALPAQESPSTNSEFEKSPIVFREMRRTYAAEVELTDRPMAGKKSPFRNGSFPIV
jgi:hypothetical protein